MMTLPSGLTYVPIVILRVQMNVIVINGKAEMPVMNVGS